MRPKEWGRSQSESVRKYRSPQKFLAQKRSELHFPLRRCGSRRTQVSPDFPTRGCDRPITANHHPSRSRRRSSWGRDRGGAHRLWKLVTRRIDGRCAPQRSAVSHSFAFQQRKYLFCVPVWVLEFDSYFDLEGHLI